MLRNYFKLAWRNFKKNKIFSFINIFGLSIGLTCCILISLYIFNELRYDRYHVNGERVFQLATTFDIDGKIETHAGTSAPLGRTLQMDYPEIQEQTRMLSLFQDDKTLLQFSEPGGEPKTFYEKGGYLADSNFFNLLTFDFKEGNPANALMEPLTVVLSQELAEKLFDKQSAINKVIHISSSTNGDADYKVTGVFKPLSLSHIDAKFIMSMKGGRMDRMANNNPSLLNNNMFFTYLMLKHKSDADNLAAKFPAFINKHLGAELKETGKNRNYVLTALKDIHLASEISKNVTAAGSKTSLYILGSIAILTLLIACINFMNLSTSSSSRRAAEVGVRKVLGAEKRSLLLQFLGESLLMSAIAFLIAILLSALLLPLFSRLSGKDINLSVADHGILFLGFLLLTLITGLLAGSYPAFYLSAFRPIQVLKGKFKNSLAAVSLRKGMVVFQFVISIALIVASLVISQQMNFMRSKDLGFTKEQQIVIPLRTATAKRIFPSLKNDLKNLPGIKSVGGSNYYPGIFNPTDWLLYREGQTKEQSKRMYINFVDFGFLKTLNIQPKEGRLFSEEFQTDTIDKIVINEQAVKDLGFSSAKEAIGKWIGFDPGDSVYKLPVIGVVKDFHFKDLHTPIEAYAFLLSTGRFNYVIANAKEGDIGSTLKSVESTWHNLNPNEPFEYSFLDQDFQKNYQAETRQAGLINYFTIIAILISCLGLFGLATFSAEQRTKEIGIRKVLGASISGIVSLLSRDFLKLVLVAVLIASPIAWYGMNKWLENFSYRISISWVVFVVTTLISVLIAFVTISFQSIRAARANPIRNLRTE